MFLDCLIAHCVGTLQKVTLPLDLKYRYPVYLNACVSMTHYVNTLQDPVFPADYDHSECYHLRPKCLVVD